ncbi:MAG TPA: hypothetical protein VGB50_06855 [Flavobacterium sp.]
MLPTVINLVIPSDMELPQDDFIPKKSTILAEIIQALGGKDTEFLTFNREEKNSRHLTSGRNVLLLEVRMNSGVLASAVGKSLNEQIIYLLKLRRVVLHEFSRKSNVIGESKETKICLEIFADIHSLSA